MKCQLGMASMASVAQELGTSWDGLYQWLKGRLEQLNVPESEMHLRSIVKIFLMNHKDLEDEEVHGEKDKAVLPRRRFGFRSARSIDESRKSVAEMYINHLLEKQMQQQAHEASDVKNLIDELSLRIGEARERKDASCQLMVQSSSAGLETGVKNATDRYNQAFPPLSEISIKTQTACTLDNKDSVWHSRLPLTCKPAKETLQKNESSEGAQTAEMSPKNGLLHKKSTRPVCKGKENELQPGKGEQKKKTSQYMKKEHLAQMQSRKSEPLVVNFVGNHKSSVHDHVYSTSYESFCRKAEQDLMSFLYSKPKFSPKQSLQPLGQKENQSWYAVPVDSLLMLTKSQRRLYRRGECYSHSSPDSPVHWPSGQKSHSGYDQISAQADMALLCKHNTPDPSIKEQQQGCTDFDCNCLDGTGESDFGVNLATGISKKVMLSEVCHELEEHTKQQAEIGQQVGKFAGGYDFRTNLSLRMEDVTFRQLRAASEPTPSSRQVAATPGRLERSGQTTPDVFVDEKADFVRWFSLANPYLSEGSTSSDEQNSRLVEGDMYKQLASCCRLNSLEENFGDASEHIHNSDFEPSVSFMGSKYMHNQHQHELGPSVELDIATISRDTLDCSINSAKQESSNFSYDFSPGAFLDHHQPTDGTSVSLENGQACISSVGNNGLFDLGVLTPMLSTTPTLCVTPTLAITPPLPIDTHSISPPGISHPAKLSLPIGNAYSENHVHPFSFSCSGCLSLNFCVWIRRCRDFGGDAMHFWTSCASGCLYIPDLDPAVTQCIQDHCHTVTEISPDKETWSVSPTVHSISQQKQEQMKFLISVGNVIFPHNPSFLEQAQERFEDIHSFSIYCKGCVSMTMYDMSVRGHRVEWGEVQSFLSSSVSGCFAVEGHVSVSARSHYQLFGKSFPKTPIAGDSFSPEEKDPALLSFRSPFGYMKIQEMPVPCIDQMQDSTKCHEAYEDRHSQFAISDHLSTQDMYKTSAHTTDDVFPLTDTFQSSPLYLEAFAPNPYSTGKGKENSLPVESHKTAPSNTYFKGIVQQDKEDSLIPLKRQMAEATADNSFPPCLLYGSPRLSSDASLGSTSDCSPQIWTDTRMGHPFVEITTAVLNPSDPVQMCSKLDCLASHPGTSNCIASHVAESGWGVYGEVITPQMTCFAATESQGDAQTYVDGCRHSFSASEGCEPCALYLGCLGTGGSCDLQATSNWNQRAPNLEWETPLWHRSYTVESRQLELPLSRLQQDHSSTCVCGTSNWDQKEKLAHEASYTEMFKWMCTQLEPEASALHSKQNHLVSKLRSVSHQEPKSIWENMGCSSQVTPKDVWGKPGYLLHLAGAWEKLDWNTTQAREFKSKDKSKKGKENVDAEMLQANICNLESPRQKEIPYRNSSHFHHRCISDSSLVLPSENSAFRACTRAHSTPALTHDSPFSIGAPLEILVGKQQDKTASFPVNVPLDVIVGAKQKINLPVYQKLQERAEARGHHFVPIRDDSKSNSRAAGEDVSASAPGDIFGVPPPAEPLPCRHQYHSSDVRHTCSGACCCPTFFYSGSDKTTQTCDLHAGEDDLPHSQHGWHESGDESRLPAFRSICSHEAGEDCEARPVTKKYEEKDWKMLQDVPDEEELLEAILTGRQVACMANTMGDGHHLSLASHTGDVGTDQAAILEFSQDSTHCNSLPYPHQAVYLAEVEEELLNSAAELANIRSRRRLCKKTPKGSGYSNKPCSFYLEGQCYRADCKFSHDTSSITCRFWEEGQCFKGDLCPFRHGYLREDTGATRRQRPSDGQFELKKNDFPALSSRKQDVRDHSAPPARRKKGARKPVVRHQPRGN